jgi:anti-sigma B factor antagonist
MSESVPSYAIAATREHEHTVVALSGEIDIATVDEVAAAVREQLASGPVLLDLQSLAFIDSCGLRMLIALRQDSEREGWSLTIGAEVHPNVRRLLDMAGMLELLTLDDGGTTAPEDR